MIFSENNWHGWQYGTGFEYSDQIKDQPFQTFHRKSNIVIGSYKEELIKAARSTIDTYPNQKFTLFFSGGADSELVLRSYLEIKHPIEVIIYRYENDYNLYDISYAVNICNMLGVPYLLLDFNLQKFYENEAEKYSELSEIDRPRSLPHLKFLETTDNIGILGQGDPWWSRKEHIDYSIKGTWEYKDTESFVGAAKFIQRINKPSIDRWLKWTPGLFLSYTRLNWFKKLVNDEITGKAGVNTSKLQGYREAYPNMLDRIKLTGFEKVDDLINEFEIFLSKKNNGLIYRQDYITSLSKIEKDILG
jgi:hypothetical protein